MAKIDSELINKKTILKKENEFSFPLFKIVLKNLPPPSGGIFHTLFFDKALDQERDP